MDGTPQQTHQTLSERTLKMAGYSYILGDAAMMAASAAREGMKGFRSGITGGGLWMAGGIAAARYGNPKSEKQLELLANKLEKYLYQKGVVIPADVRAQNTLLKEESFWEKIENFLYEYPSQVLNSCYALGSGMLLYGGAHKMRAGEESFFGTGGRKVSKDFWIGALVLTGVLGGLLIKEDPEARKNAEGKGALEETKAYFQESPLRWSALAYGACNLGVLAQAVEDFKDKKQQFTTKKFKPHYASFTQLVAYVASNILLFLSPRDQISHHFSAEHTAQLEDAAARIIAAQPAAQQQQTLANVTQFMIDQKRFSGDANVIATDIAARVSALTAERMKQAASDISWQARTAAGPTEAVIR